MLLKKSAWIGIAICVLIVIVSAGMILLSKNDAGQGQTPSQPDIEGSTDNAQAPANKENDKPDVPVAEESYDVVVIGSELEGMYLARAAADEGLRVKILDPRETVGGQLIQGEMLFLDETTDDAHRSLVQGRAKELFDGFKSGKIRKLKEFEQYYNKLIKDIPIESGIRIENISTTDGRDKGQAVASISYKSKDQSMKKVKAAYWVENTDFGAMTSKLQVTRLPGLEKFYGQSQIEYMSSGMMMKFKNVDWKAFSTHFNKLSQQEKSKLYGGGYVNESFAIGLSGMTSAYKPTNDRVFLRGLNALYQRDNEVIINAFLIYTVNPADQKSIDEAMELGKKEIPLILDHFRKHMVGWEKAELNGFPSYLYIREFDHYETDYVLKPSDMLGAKMFWDNVSIAGYPLDLQGISVNKWGIEMGRPDKYGMPLRSFLLKNYDNVILAGKNVGSSAIAYGSARIQPNTSIAAESIGIILGQINGNKKLKQLTEEDMRSLHEYIRSKYNIQLSGVTGKNKIAGWTDEEIRKLDAGEIIFSTYSKSRK